jgi:hypothetical protein
MESQRMIWGDEKLKLEAKRHSELYVIIQSDSKFLSGFLMDYNFQIEKERSRKLLTEYEILTRKVLLLV